MESAFDEQIAIALQSLQLLPIVRGWVDVATKVALDVSESLAQQLLVD